MKRFWYLAPLAGILALVVLFGLGLGRDTNRLPSMLIGQFLPEFSVPVLASIPNQVTARDDQRFDRDLVVLALQKQPVLLNFFASWCIPCQAEHPILRRIGRDEGVGLLGVAWKDKAEAATTWLNRMGVIFRAVGLDQDNQAGFQFGVYGVPETYLIDGRGRVRVRHAGPVTAEIWRDEFEPVLTTMRAEAR